MSSKPEPAGEAFVGASRLSGWAQLAPPIEITAIANEQRTAFIILCFVVVLLSARYFPVPATSKANAIARFQPMARPSCSALLAASAPIRSRAGGI